MGPLLVLSLSLAAAPQVNLKVGYESLVLPWRGFDLVAGTDHLPFLRLEGGVAFPLPFGALDVHLAARAGSRSEDVHRGASRAALTLLGGELGATLRLKAHQYLWPWVQLAGTLDAATLWVGNAAQAVASPGGQAVVGLQVPVPLGASWSAAKDGSPVLLLELGLGYALRPQASYTELQRPTPTPPPEDPIAQRPLSVGPLPLSGVVARAQVGLRF